MCHVISSESVKMGDAGIALVVFMLFGVLIIAKAEIYIVTVEGEPVISYRGGVDGFEATAVESDEELDVTRYSTTFISWRFNTSGN